MDMDMDQDKEERIVVIISWKNNNVITFEKLIKMHQG